MDEHKIDEQKGGEGTETQTADERGEKFQKINEHKGETNERKKTANRPRRTNSILGRTLIFAFEEDDPSPPFKGGHPATLGVESALFVRRLSLAKPSDSGFSRTLV